MVLPQLCLFLKQSPKMQANPTIKYHYASTTMTRIFLKTENTKCWQGCGEIRLLTLLIQLENGAPPVENGSVLAEEDEHRNTT